MSNLSTGETFRVGEVWLSPKNYYYKVTEVKGEQATLRMGMDGSNRKVYRDKNKVIGWTLVIEGSGD
jgi:hypothetical protein